MPRRQQRSRIEVVDIADEEDDDDRGRRPWRPQAPRTPQAPQGDIGAPMRASTPEPTSSQRGRDVERGRPGERRDAHPQRHREQDRPLRVPLEDYARLHRFQEARIRQSTDMSFHGLQATG